MVEDVVYKHDPNVRSGMDSWKHGAGSLNHIVESLRHLNRWGSVTRDKEWVQVFFPEGTRESAPHRILLHFAAGMLRSSGKISLGG